MHLLEAALRVRARQQNRYLVKYYRSTKSSEAPWQRNLYYTCERGHGGCSYFVRLIEISKGVFRCTKIDPGHTCSRAADELPGSKLSSRMSAFVGLRDSFFLARAQLTVLHTAISQPCARGHRCAANHRVRGEGELRGQVSAMIC